MSTLAALASRANPESVRALERRAFSCIRESHLQPKT
jgi:hypothetical protein